jgi:hypothetical protein
MGSTDISSISYSINRRAAQISSPGDTVLTDGKPRYLLGNTVLTDGQHRYILQQIQY